MHNWEFPVHKKITPMLTCPIRPVLCVFSFSIFFVQPVKTLSYNIVNLIEDSTYYFRVLAVNAAGEGKPSEESAKVVVKDPKGTELSDG